MTIGALLAASHASAQPAKPTHHAKPPPVAPKPAAEPDPSLEKKQEARERFERAMLLFDKKLWDVALVEFLASRAAYPTRSNTQNAAICLRNLDRFDESLDLFELLLREFTSLSDTDKTAVQKEITELQALVGSIAIRTPEEGALVTIDGRERGSTPTAPVRVSAGSHIVRIYKEGFVPVEKRVDVAGRQSALVDIKLEMLAQAGRLSVTEDSGRIADVVVDNAVVGKTPWQGPVAVGDHVVFLRGEGNLGTQPAATSTRINQVTPIVLALEPLECPLRIEPYPGGATVAVDGVVVSSGLWDGRLRKGRHKIEVAQLGFLPQERTLELSAAKSERLLIQLERDPNSPLWRVVRPPHIFIEAAPSFPIVALLGGDVSNGGNASFPLGVAGRLHVGYELRTGFGLSLDAGYLYLAREVSNREAVLRPVGKPESRGTVTDRLSLRGLLVGAAAQLHRGDKFPLLLRFGVGALLGNVSDRRAGDFPTGAGSVAVPTARTDADLSYLYVAPEVRLGYRLSERLELSVGTDVMLLVGLKTARWNTDNSVVLGNQGLASYERQQLLGSTLIIVNPGLAARFDF